MSNSQQTTNTQPTSPVVANIGVNLLFKWTVVRGKEQMQARHVDGDVTTVFVPNAHKGIRIEEEGLYRCVLGRVVFTSPDCTFRIQVVDAAKMVVSAKPQPKGLTPAQIELRRQKAMKLEQAREAAQAAAAAARMRSQTAGKDPNARGGGGGENKNKQKKGGKR